MNIATQKWKVSYGKIEVVPFVNTEMRRSIGLRRILNFKFTRIDEVNKLRNHSIIQSKNIIYVPIGEIEFLSKVFRTSF